MTLVEIPTLSTERLILRALRRSDWDAFAAMEAMPEVRRFRGGNILDRAEAWTSMERMLGQWAMRGYGVFALERLPPDGGGGNSSNSLSESGRFVGFAGILHPADWPEPELAYTLDPAYWGRGYAIEAAARARDWAFEQFGFERLASFIMPENVRSVRVAEALGAVREGTVALRGHVAEWWVHHRPGRGAVA